LVDVKKKSGVYDLVPLLIGKEKTFGSN